MGRLAPGAHIAWSLRSGPRARGGGAGLHADFAHLAGGRRGQCGPRRLAQRGAGRGWEGLLDVLRALTMSRQGKVSVAAIAAGSPGDAETHHVGGALELTGRAEPASATTPVVSGGRRVGCSPAWTGHPVRADVLLRFAAQIPQMSGTKRRSRQALLMATVEALGVRRRSGQLVPGEPQYMPPRRWGRPMGRYFAISPWRAQSSASTSCRRTGRRLGRCSCCSG